ncbi:MAG: hypothetical protein JW751_31440 [Polyangiaceae bacterium]|nr:hypothetical protein [Polyangiaceae bacterium]
MPQRLLHRRRLLQHRGSAALRRAGNRRQTLLGEHGRTYGTYLRHLACVAEGAGATASCTELATVSCD